METIRNWLNSDKGLYTCKATNTFGVVSSSANLMVATSEIREAPVFHEPLVNVEVITGQPLHLECQISGIPSPDLTWKHNNKPILPSNLGYEIQYNSHTQWASLNVKEAFPKVSGRYTCRAKNIAGEATTTAVVCVKGIPPTEVSDTEAMNESDPKFQASKPAFYVPLKNQVLDSVHYKLVRKNDTDITYWCSYRVSGLELYFFTMLL